MTDIQRPSGFPTSWVVEKIINEHLQHHSWLHRLEIWASFKDNHFTWEDRVHLVDFLEDLYQIKITDEEFEWADKPLRLIGLIQAHVSRAPAS